MYAPLYYYYYRGNIHAESRRGLRPTAITQSHDHIILLCTGMVYALLRTTTGAHVDNGY